MTPIDTSAVPARRADCRIELIDDEMLVYKAGETKAIFFNQTASLVWHLCDGQRTAAEIATLLTDAFPDADDSIDEDVMDALSRFLEHGCIDLT